MSCWIYFKTNLHSTVLLLKIAKTQIWVVKETKFNDTPQNSAARPPITYNQQFQTSICIIHTANTCSGGKFHEVPEAQYPDQ